MKKPEIVLIAAVARNGTIGRDNELPWRLKADLQHFRALTLGHPILMGRKTWQSLGRPLPGRRNLVVSRTPDYRAEGAECFADPAAAIAAAGEAQTLFVIGGAQLYALLLPLADRLELTEVKADVEGDAHFPAVDPARFVEERRETHHADADNAFDFDFVRYCRR
ncbi:MAG TPA: dihydrofolate reductase [Thauera aminoaromatica]|nr:dihydrofolate reductase [Thauera aminoaromatica]